MKKLLSLILCITFCFSALPNIFAVSVSAATAKPKKAVSYIASRDAYLFGHYHFRKANHYYYYYGNDPKLLKIPKGAILTDGSDLKNLDSLVVPKEVKTIGKIESDRLKELNIGMSDISFEGELGFAECFQLPSLTKFSTNKNNRRFSAKNGVLYHHYYKYYSKTQLAAYPTAKKGSYFKIDNTVSLIGSQAFIQNKYLKKIVLPTNLQNLNCMLPFSRCKNLVEIVINGTNTLHLDHRHGIVSGPNLKRIVLNNKNTGFVFSKAKDSLAQEIAWYQKEYKNVTFYVKPNSRALKEVQILGLQYKLIK